MSDTLFDMFTVHCFFQRWCNHKVTGIDPQANHDEMEAHYESVHYPKHLQIVAPGIEYAQPKRIQRSADWKPSKGAVWVGPRSKFYNPFAAKLKGGESGLATMTRQYLVDDYREWLLTPVTKWPDRPAFSRGDTRNTGMLGVPWEPRPTLDEIKSLRGKDLVCRCHAGQPCHADVLLELANSEVAA